MVLMSGYQIVGTILFQKSIHIRSFFSSQCYSEMIQNHSFYSFSYHFHLAYMLNFETFDKVYDAMVMPDPVSFFPRGAKLGARK